MNIEIWSIGKQNEGFINDGIIYYFKKIKPFCSISLEIITPKKSFSDPLTIKKYEEELILKKLQDHHYLILLDERGKKLDSPSWAKGIQKCMNSGVRTLVFLIGGAYGVSDTIQNTARETWSFSDLVFPHQLVRLMVAEQIYRSFAIIHNLPYHHS